MSLTVTYMCDQALRFAKLFADNLNDLNILFLVVSAYIVDFSNSSVMDDQIDCLAVVLYIQPVTNIQTFSVNWKRLVCQRICDHQRNQFVRKMIWSVVVAAS